MIKVLDVTGGRALLGALATLYARSATRADIEIRYVDGLWVHRVGAHSFPTSPRFLYFADSFSKIVNQADEEIETATDYWFQHYTPQRGDVIVDIGAGRGEDALAFSRAVGAEGRVLAVEAHPLTFKMLELFRRLNGLANTRPIWLALMDRVGTVSMIESGNWEGHAVEWAQPSSQGAVPATTLDALCESEGISDIAFLKMNIEGAEQQAILGMKASIKRIKAICIACHDFRAERGDGEHFRTRAIIEKFLQDSGFSVASRLDDVRPFVRDHVYGFRQVPIQRSDAS